MLGDEYLRVLAIIIWKDEPETRMTFVHFPNTLIAFFVTESLSANFFGII